MKIIVTGASGFLGRALMKYFYQSGIHVVGVSRRYTPGLMQLASYNDTPGGDVLVHLAEASDRAYAQDNEPLYERQALKTLEVLQKKGFSRLVYASSAVLYGDQGVELRKVGDPVFESDAYTRLKLASERAVLAHGGVVARLGNLYGPGMAESNVLSTILKQVGNGDAVRVLDVTPVRDFLWIADAARALGLMAMGKASGIFNVGSGQGVSIHELAGVALNAVGCGARTIEANHVCSGFSRLVLDISQTESTFGWRPTVNLGDGISTLIKQLILKE